MSNPIIIITGASRGLGAAAARAAAQMGADLALAARSQEMLEQVCEDVRRLGRQALAVPGDVGQEAFCQELVRRAAERFGRVDGLVNNAGIIEPIARVADADPQEWTRSWAINVLGPVLLVRAALPYLRESQGRVINISSGSASHPIPAWSAYSAAKAAIDLFTRILAAEEPTVTAVAVRPGVVDTAMQAEIRAQGQNVMADKDYHRLADPFYQGTMQKPEGPGRAIAALALFAPREWSGEVMTWNEDRVQALAAQSREER